MFLLLAGSPWCTVGLVQDEYKNWHDCVWRSIWFWLKTNTVLPHSWLNVFTLFTVYSQFWLNLPRDDCHFFYIFNEWSPRLLWTEIHKIEYWPVHYVCYKIGRMDAMAPLVWLVCYIAYNKFSVDSLPFSHT